jgi:hypothetical protein
MVPRTGRTLLVAIERVPRMIMRGRNEAHAHEEHADHCSYRTPFHSSLHSYSAPATFFKQNRPVTRLIGASAAKLNS